MKDKIEKVNKDSVRITFYAPMELFAHILADIDAGKYGEITRKICEILKDHYEEKKKKAN